MEYSPHGAFRLSRLSPGSNQRPRRPPWDGRFQAPSSRISRLGPSTCGCWRLGSLGLGWDMIWLVVTGCHFWHFPRNIGFMSSSQLTNSNLFQRGGYTTTNQMDILPWSTRMASAQLDGVKAMLSSDFPIPRAKIWTQELEFLQRITAIQPPPLAAKSPEQAPPVVPRRETTDIFFGKRPVLEWETLWLMMIHDDWWW